MVARVDTAPQAVGTPPHSLIADGLRFVEPAPPGEDKFPSPYHYNDFSCLLGGIRARVARLCRGYVLAW